VLVHRSPFGAFHVTWCLRDCHQYIAVQRFTRGFTKFFRNFYVGMIIFVGGGGYGAVLSITEVLRIGGE